MKELPEWSYTLREAQGRDFGDDIEYREKVVDAFRQMWASNPTIEEFRGYMNNMLVLPEFAYIMATGVSR